MSVSGGGWTRLTDTVASAVLNLDSNVEREYLFVKNGQWYRTPVSNLIWDWNVGKQLTGTYYYSNGSDEANFSLVGSGETNLYGVGCSNGGGGQWKVLIYYSTGKDPANAKVQLCQDLPGIFGGGCQSDVTVYIRDIQDYQGGFHIVSCTPSGLIKNPVSYVDIKFSADVNATSFTTSDVSMTGPNGAININTIENKGQNVWRISFSTQSTDGEYHLYIGPHIEDIYGNEMDQEGDGDGGQEPNDIYDTAFTINLQNEGPVVNAGSDQTITLPASASLDGTVTDDGLPNPPGALTTLWTMQSGPGTVTFGNANDVDTTASFSLSGTYVLRLTANDGNLPSYDEVNITVQSAIINVNGHITVDTVWDNAETTYQINSDLYIDSGATLTLASGVKLRTGDGYYQDIFVNGSLVGNGATIETPSWASHVYVQSGGKLDLTGGAVNGGPGYPSIDVASDGVANFTGVTFSSARVNYANGSSGTLDNCSGSWNLNIASDGVLFKNSTIGYVTLSGGAPTITGNTFSDSHPIRIEDPDVNTSGITGNTYTSAETWIYIYGTLNTLQQLGIVDTIGRYQIMVSTACELNQTRSKIRAATQLKAAC